MSAMSSSRSSSPRGRYVPPERDGYECVSYIDDILEGRITACEKLKKLCRMLKPRFEDGYKCWRYDPERASRPVRFIERFCCLPEGKAGQHLVLEPFQLFWMEVAFGFIDENGFRQFQEVFHLRGRKNGKALSLDTEIPTPDGWKQMRDIHVGDYVFGTDGKPSRVTIESEIFDKDMYLVEFEDGASLKASADHLWTVKTKKSVRNARKNGSSQWVTMSTSDMADDYVRLRADGKGVERRYRVPMCRPVEYVEKELPIDPYVLGVWIGDGTASMPTISCADDDLDEMMYFLSQSGMPVYGKKYLNRPGCAWTISVGSHGRGGKDRNELMRGLRKLGLVNNKHIPSQYMIASTDQRMELLRGLMDTDGYVSKAGQCEFTQKNEGIVDQFIELCASLGIKATKRTHRATCSGKDAGDVFTAMFFTDRRRCCFKLGRKAARLKEHLADRMGAKSIAKITRIPNEPSKCIAIDNDSHLYLAGRQYTATHNTSESAALGLYMLTKDGENAPQCYSSANSKAQAALLYGAMLRMVAQSPHLSRRLHKGTVAARSQDGLIYNANGGFFTPLSSQTRNLDGLNVHFSVQDEVAACTNRDVYDLVKQATSARDQPLILEITTNGFERDNFFDEQYEYASRILDGKAVDDTFLPVIYELDDRNEWSDESKWIKANPGLGTIKKVEALRGYVNKAKQDPSFLPTVLTKDFNIPENKASAWLRYDEAVNRDTFDWREMGFRYCIIGYDASDTIDLTSAQALMMRPGDERIYEMSMYWIPEAQLEKSKRSGLRKDRDNVPYQKWIDDGLVRVVPGNTIDHRCVFEWMQELRDEYDIYPFAMGYDPWHLQDDSWKETARQFVGRNRAEQVRFGAKSLSIPMKQIRADYERHRIVDNDNPVNQWCRMNVGIVTDKNDNIQPVKANGATGRIDGWAAEICAYIALGRHMEDYASSI